MEKVDVNKTITLSEHYTLGELTKTSTGMMNIPSRVSIENMKRVCGWLEALRCRYNQRYVISRKEEGGKRKENTSAESSALRVTSSPPELGGVPVRAGWSEEGAAVTSRWSEEGAAVTSGWSEEGET